MGTSAYPASWGQNSWRASPVARPAPRTPSQFHGSVAGNYRPWAQEVDSSTAARSASLTTKAPNSAGLMCMGSASCCVSHSDSSAVARVSAMSRASVLTMPAGVCAGAQIPYQIGKSKPATPACCERRYVRQQARAARCADPERDEPAVLKVGSGGRDRQHRVCGVSGRRAGDHIGDCVRGCGRRVHCGDAEVAIELRHREVGAGAGAGGGEADLAGPVAGRGGELVDGGDAGLRAGDEYVGLAGERSDGNEVPQGVVRQLACPGRRCMPGRWC